MNQAPTTLTRTVQLSSNRYTEHQAEAEAGIEPLVGMVSESHGNALVKTINGLYKAEIIYRRSQVNRETVELATLNWVDWINHQRLLGPIGNIPAAGRRRRRTIIDKNLPCPWQRDSNQTVSGILRAIQSAIVMRIDSFPYHPQTCAGQVC